MQNVESLFNTPTLLSDHQALYQGLRNTGIDYHFSKKNTLLQSHRPIVCTACLIVLDHDPQQLTVSQQKILDGMLKVLDLKETDYCVTWIAKDPIPVTAEAFIQAILKYAPYSLLFLGAAFSDPIASIDTIMSAKVGIHMAHTYSPLELEADPTHKRSAFETLLSLKKLILLPQAERDQGAL